MQKYRSMSVFPIITQEQLDVLRLAYTVCLYFESIWNTLLAQCSDQPDLAMITYMSDGWARKVWAITKDSVNGISITHAQRVTKEYLLQRAILKVWNGSSFRSALGLVGARPLLDGKTAWDVYTCLHAFHKPLPFYNRGPCVSIYIFDGHLCGPLVRHAKACNALFNKSLIDSQREDETAQGFSCPLALLAHM